MEINQISPLESEFTEVLSTIALKPKILYYYGKLPKKRLKSVAIVGSRRNTPYGQEIAYQAAFEAARAGVVVVSGLAHGIDSIAHRGALDAGGITIAVLGTPITKIYPYDHTDLALEIIEKGGAVISEYGPHGEGGHGESGAVCFLYRNRIIAGLADTVLVAEAAKQSGSLNTASHALEQGKDVLAVPGNVNQVFSEGCNNLLASGALVYRQPNDLLETVFPGYAAKKSKKRRAEVFRGSPVEKAIMEQLARGVKDGEEIVRRAGLTISDYNQAISLLEIRGYVQSLGGNQWMMR